MITGTPVIIFYCPDVLSGRTITHGLFVL